VEQFVSLRDEQITSLVQSLEELRTLELQTEEGQGEELQCWSELVGNCVEAYNQVARKVRVHVSPKKQPVHRHILRAFLRNGFHVNLCLLYSDLRAGEVPVQVSGVVGGF
jgi:hypothetical protein